MNSAQNDAGLNDFMSSLTQHLGAAETWMEEAEQRYDEGEFAAASAAAAISALHYARGRIS